MRSALKIAGGIVIGFLALIGLGALCALAFDSLARSGSAPLPGIFPPGIPLPRAIPAAIGQSIRRGDLLIAPRTYRLTGAYRSELGVEERPPAGAGFLWVLIVVENIGERVVDAPTVWDFYILHKGVQLQADSVFFEPPAMAAYRGGRAYPGGQEAGWLRFTVPARARPEDLLLVLRPFAGLREEAVWRLTP